MRSKLALICAAFVGCAPQPKDWIKPFNKAAAIPYVKEVGQDFWQSPAQTKLMGGGDCEDKSFVLHRDLKKLGYDPEVHFGLANATNPRTGHAWVEMQICGENYILDPTSGVIARRNNLPPTAFMRLNRPEYAKQLRDYRKRNNVPKDFIINRTYDE